MHRSRGRFVCLTIPYDLQSSCGIPCCHPSPWRHPSSQLFRRLPCSTSTRRASFPPESTIRFRNGGTTVLPVMAYIKASRSEASRKEVSSVSGQFTDASICLTSFGRRRHSHSSFAPRVPTANHLGLAPCQAPFHLRPRGQAGFRFPRHLRDQAPVLLVL